MFLLAIGVMCLTACAQRKGGERGPRQGGHMEINKDSDSVFVALKQEALGKFKQLTFNDELTGKTMEYNLLVLEGADAGQKLPLVLFMADASTARRWCSNHLARPSRYIAEPIRMKDASAGLYLKRTPRRRSPA